MKRLGLTLIEILVVFSIISVLVGLLLPAVQAARESARRTQCQNNLRQVGLALLNYESANRILPSGAIVTTGNGPERLIKHSWFPSVLPFMEQSALSSQYRSDVDYSDSSQSGVTKIRLPIMVCPSDTSPEMKSLASGVDASVHSYHPCSGIAPELIQMMVTKGFLSSAQYKTVFPNEGGKWSPSRMSDIQDGLSNTIMMGEVHSLGLVLTRRHLGHYDPYFELVGSSYSPDSVLKMHGAVHPTLDWPGPLWGITNGNGGDAEYYSEHPNKINHFLFADGSVRGLSADTLTLPELIKLLSVNDGQQVEN